MLNIMLKNSSEYKKNEENKAIEIVADIAALLLKHSNLFCSDTLNKAASVIKTETDRLDEPENKAEKARREGHVTDVNKANRYLAKFTAVRVKGLKVAKDRKAFKGLKDKLPKVSKAPKAEDPTSPKATGKAPKATGKAPKATGKNQIPVVEGVAVKQEQNSPQLVGHQNTEDQSTETESDEEQSPETSPQPKEEQSPETTSKPIETIDLCDDSDDCD